MRIDPKALKRDRPFNFAFLAGLACALVLSVSILMVRWPAGAGWMQQRGSPGYWLAMLPAAIWVWSISSYARWAVAMLPVVLVGTPVAFAALALAGVPVADAATGDLWWWAAGITLVPTALGLRWCRLSPVWRR